MAIVSRYDWSGATKPVLPTTDHFPWQSAQKTQPGFNFFIGQIASSQPNLAFSNFSMWEFLFRNVPENGVGYLDFLEQVHKLFFETVGNSSVHPRS
jgi:hypothetical protein